MIDRRIASELLDFGARIGGGQRADEQLEGAVAIHNILQERGIAYLADEVGMGKTYVALGALALFRHFNPDFRVLVIAPRENIQNKWMHEMGKFVRYNVRFSDLRVKALDDAPLRPRVACANLLDLLKEVTLSHQRDFFMRMTSFSLGLAGRDVVDTDAGRELRDELRRHLPWAKDEIFDLRSKQAFKDNVARALCCALPVFDLVIVDESHNLKHGFGENVSARNRVMGLAFGHASDRNDSRLFPNYGSRARRVLLLSATPVEESYKHLWNQLEVFGRGADFEDLMRTDLEEEHQKNIARQFLIRRVTSIRICGQDHTKNLYRREWRRGGVYVHDEPIRLEGVKQRLTVALVQKKVSEVLAHEKFNSSFQIGMLASFESFLETARVKREKKKKDEEGVFDDTQQTDDELEREGIDVKDVNLLARRYRESFGEELPHPKMDALVDCLARSWENGEKALVFVRRVASVKELRRKLNERYDAWLWKRLRSELDAALQSRLEALFKQYANEKKEALARGEDEGVLDDTSADRGGADSFFAWFFRGEGPRGVVSGANIQGRFIQKGGTFATFFAENYVAALLEAEPGSVASNLAAALSVTKEELGAGLRERARRYLTRAKRPQRADLYEAAQAAAVEWLRDAESPLRDRARLIWNDRFATSVQRLPTTATHDVLEWLELRTFFTELQRREALCARLWPQASGSDARHAFRERELRAQLLSSTARLGHALIDLYVLVVNRLGTLEQRKQETGEAGEDFETARINEYLDLLERQMNTSRSARPWGAFDELADGAQHFQLVLDANEPDLPEKPLVETARVLGTLLGQQQPVGGMSGQLNQTLVRQFRMPGYPLILVTTDLLQEGEDLHTFCSAVHHYGISWTPSSMEQRIGRIDRVRSQTEYRLKAIKDLPLAGDDMLQVYFPHLEDTVEVFQVRRVLERMNVFLRLMHEGLTTAGTEERTINTAIEVLRSHRDVPPIRERLISAFPVTKAHLKGSRKALAVGPGHAAQLEVRFRRLPAAMGDLPIDWEPISDGGRLLGTMRLQDRIQPFTLLLRSIGAWPSIRCISPVGRVGMDDERAAVVAASAAYHVKLGAIPTAEERTYDFTVEGDVLLASEKHDATRVSALIRRVVGRADILEQEHLPGTDQPLETFRDDLVREGSNA